MAEETTQRTKFIEKLFEAVHNGRFRNGVEFEEGKDDDTVFILFDYGRRRVMDIRWDEEKLYYACLIDKEAYHGNIILPLEYMALEHLFYLINRVTFFGKSN